MKIVESLADGLRRRVPFSNNKLNDQEWLQLAETVVEKLAENGVSLEKRIV